ncbi:hypothetical protein SDC9_82116 [bioreactor metagenome]|uniref:Uncharacterized protein n=1 Tax=bioreactor metagenome TaxID=1076179 RepID=A0A644Z9X9_9ZZZZ
MNELHSMVGAEESSDIVFGYIADRQKRQEYTEYKAEQQEAMAKKSGDCKTAKIPLDNIEEMLAKQFGDKLKPRRFDNVKPPSVMDLRDLVGKPKKDKPAKPKLEQAKLEPKHLTAERLRKLVSDGKTEAEIMKMYNFNSRTYLIQVVGQIGCRGIFKRAKLNTGD